MNHQTFLLLLLMPHAINLSAEENPTQTESAQTQPSPSVPDVKTEVNAADKKQLTGRELIQQNLEMARLAAEIDRKRELYAKGPKRKYISASTQAYEYRDYMSVFVKKLEEVGNANYPEEFKRKNVSVRVTITISIGRDGTLEDVRFISISNEKPAVVSALKEAVLKIVSASAPFAPLPETAEKIDFLHITRTWDFGDGDY